MDPSTLQRIPKWKETTSKARTNHTSTTRASRGRKFMRCRATALQKQTLDWLDWHIRFFFILFFRLVLLTSQLISLLSCQRFSAHLSSSKLLLNIWRFKGARPTKRLPPSATTLMQLTSPQKWHAEILRSWAHGRHSRIWSVASYGVLELLLVAPISIQKFPHLPSPEETTRLICVYLY